MLKLAQWFNAASRFDSTLDSCNVLLVGLSQSASKGRFMSFNGRLNFCYFAGFDFKINLIAFKCHYCLAPISGTQVSGPD